MAEAVVESRQRAAKDLIPPRFILNLTIDQMRRFVSTPPAQNPFVTSLDERAAAIKELAPADRAAAVAQAERIVRESIYPEWQQGDRVSGIARAALGRSRGLVAPRRGRRGV